MVIRKHIQKYFYLLIIFLISFCPIVFSQENKINEEINNIKNNVLILQREKNIRQKELELDIKDYKLKIDESIKIVHLILSICGISIFGVSIAGFIYIKRFIKEQSEHICKEIIKERISNIIDENKSKIVDLVKSQDLELRIKSERTIVVISKNQQDEVPIKNLFLKFGFQKVNYSVINTYQAINNCDLIVFNCIDSQFDDDFIKSYLDEANISHSFIYYGNFLPVLNNYRDKVNSANSKFTLYSNILNLLKFKELF